MSTFLKLKENLHRYHVYYLSRLQQNVKYCTSQCCAIIELIRRLHCVDQLVLLRNQLCMTQFESKGVKLYLK